MMKRTIVISQRSYIFHKDEQLHIRISDESGFEEGKSGSVNEPTVPIEDIGVVILEDHRSTISTSALNALMENDSVLIGCDSRHMPNSIMYPISANVLHTAVLETQLKASAPLRKRLWQQTVKSKLGNQAVVLRSRGVNSNPIELWVKKVRSGDQGNLEGRGAAYYWKYFLTKNTNQRWSEKPDGKARDMFIRDPDGDGLNAALNYGYAILRAAMARAIVGSGLHPSIGLHHKNQYNAFCLADDLMEPYRPFVDLIVLRLYDEQGEEIELTMDNKKRLLSILSVDTILEGETKPLMLSLTATSASLVKCFSGDVKKISYPEIAMGTD